MPPVGWGTTAGSGKRASTNSATTRSCWSSKKHRRSTMTATNTQSTASKISGYAPVDGLDVYYEVHGGDPAAGTTPIVLLPGGLMAIETEWEADILPRFSRTRPVIAIELQGHGYTADRD